MAKIGSFNEAEWEYPVQDGVIGNVSQGDWEFDVPEKTKSKPTLGQSIVYGVAQPFVKTGLSIAKKLGDLGVTGGINKSGQALERQFETKGFDVAIDSPREALGALGESVLNVLPIGGVGRLGKALGASGKALKSVPLASTFGKTAAEGALTGGLQTGLQTLQGDTQSLGEYAKNIGVGSLTGGALNAVAGFIIPKTLKITTDAGKVITGKTTPRMVENAISNYEKALVSGASKYESTRKFMNSMLSKNKNVVRDFAETGYTPKIQDNKFIFDDTIEKISDDISNLYEGEQGGAFATYLDQFSDKLTEATDLEQDILTAMKKSGDFEATFSEDAAKLRRLLMNQQESGAIKGGVYTPNDIRRLQIIANKATKAYDTPDSRISNDLANVIGRWAAKKLDDLTGDTVVKDINKKVSKLIGARTFASKMNGKMFGGGQMSRYMARLLGATIGSTGNVPILSPILGALGGDFAVSLLQQLQFTNPVRKKILSELVKDTTLQKRLLESIPKAKQDFIRREIQRSSKNLLPVGRGTTVQNFITRTPSARLPDEKGVPFGK